MELNEIMELDKKYFVNTFGSRTPVCFEYGKGINLWSTDGKKYTDLFAGIAVSALGHSHPNLVDAIKTQAEKFIHCSNLYYIEPQAKLAKALVENSCADKVFFSNSGAEANEAAIKLARIYFKKKGMPEKYEIITLEKSFHGRTLATIAATGQDKYQKPYCPLTPSFTSVPANDLEALKNAINENTCAVMLEPIQGEGGINLLSPEYMKGVRELCDKEGIFLILDEVQSGLGRTGKLLAYQHFDIEPDIFTLAKALGGGFPIGAMCAKDHVAKAFEPGDHGSTFGGNPLACAAGLAVVETMLNEKLVENSAKMGDYFIEQLCSLKEKYSFISDIRGKGLMIGIEVSNGKAKELVTACFESGYLVGNVGPGIMRVLPPLIVSKEDIDGFINVFDIILSRFSN
ncbi:MAG TPA: aspartate aminotransferase family protein [Pseudobacteroides sp.]|uniref:aspartate aminotransferase family protein n=1 Tax=Pseudobacteroides sp. TaxID=1968840 RepID=UPI002F93A7C7